MHQRAPSLTSSRADTDTDSRGFALPRPGSSWHHSHSLSRPVRSGVSASDTPCSPRAWPRCTLGDHAQSASQRRRDLHALHSRCSWQALARTRMNLSISQEMRSSPNWRLAVSARRGAVRTLSLAPLPVCASTGARIVNCSLQPGWPLLKIRIIRSQASLSHSQKWRSRCSVQERIRESRTHAAHGPWRRDSRSIAQGMERSRSIDTGQNGRS